MDTGQREEVSVGTHVGDCRRGEDGQVGAFCYIPGLRASLSNKSEYGRKRARTYIPSVCVLDLLGLVGPGAPVQSLTMHSREFGPVAPKVLSLWTSVSCIPPASAPWLVSWL